MSDKKFGLIIPQKADKFKKLTHSVFGDESDEDDKKSKRPKIPQKKIDFKSKIKQESVEDPSIYEYDSIYDDMKAKQAESVTPKEKKNSRYIDTLLKAADKRKKEYERRIDKKIQAEREKEGDMYKDKEAFVTSSYKKKLQEKEEEEERERRENMLNDMMDISKQKDLSGFYRHFLKQTVGEEKIPVFGEKHIKQEVTSDSESMKESKNTDHTNLDQDSDGIDVDSDSDSEDKSSRSDEDTIHEKKGVIKNNTQKDRDCEDVNFDKKRNIFKDKSKDLPQRKKLKNHSQKMNDISNSDSGSSDSEDDVRHKKDSHLDICEKKKTVIKHSRHHSSSSDDEINKTSDELKAQDKIINKSCTRKTNIYAKRTVGDLFIAAQTRYFQRIALKSK